MAMVSTRSLESFTGVDFVPIKDPKGDPSLSSFGCSDPRKTDKAALAAGELGVAIGLSERTGAREGAGLRCEGDTLSGSALFVLGPHCRSNSLIGECQRWPTTFLGGCTDDGGSSRIVGVAIGDVDGFDNRSESDFQS